MPAECTFTLPNGRKCRALAAHGRSVCHHHGAPRQARPRVDDDLWNRLSCWRDLGREIREIPKEEIPGYILNLLQALLDNLVSDRFAGRSLRILLQRLGALPLDIMPQFDLAPFAQPVRQLSREQLIEQCRALIEDLPLSQPPAVHSQPPAIHSRPPAIHSRPSAEYPHGRLAPDSPGGTYRQPISRGLA